MEWATVSMRMDNLFWDLFYFIFLTVIMIHSYVGIRGILFEFIVSETGRKIVSIILGIIWLAFYIYGLLPIFAYVVYG